MYLYIIILLLIVGFVVYFVLNKCPKCEECKTCEVCKVHDVFKIDLYSGEIAALSSLNSAYRLAINNDKDKLELVFIDAPKKTISTVRSFDLNGKGKTIGSNMKGQLVVLDEAQKEVFSYPTIYPFASSYSPYYIYISNEGKVIARDPVSNNVMWEM